MHANKSAARIESNADAKLFGLDMSELSGRLEPYRGRVPVAAKYRLGMR